MPIPISERGLSLGVIVATIAVFSIALVLVPPFSVTFDEARYVGVGYSMVEGQGPRTIFGDYFLPHAPMWSTLVVAPAVALGVEPLAVGRTLNALSAVGLIALSAAFGWRIRPAAGAAAALGLLATPYLMELTRTSRLDVPSAMLAAAYLAIGLVAVRRGSTWLAIAAGLVLGAAFLLKEIVLPLAPVPMLAAVLHRQPWRPILWSTGWLTLAATLIVAPWFVVVAQLTDRVYRLGTPAWTLLPIGIFLIGIWICGLVFGRSATLIGSGIGRFHLEGRRRTWLVIACTAAWVISLTLVFTGTLGTRGTDLVDPAQIIRYLRTWYPTLLTSAIGAVGLLFAFLARRDRQLGQRDAVEDIWLATICGLPLVVLVIGVGEAPRNYLAQLAIGAGLSGAGWLLAFQRSIRSYPRLTIVVVAVASGAAFGIALKEDLGLRFASALAAGMAAGLVVGVATAIVGRTRAAGTGAPVRSDRALAGLLILGLLVASSVTVVSLDEGAPSDARTESVVAVADWTRSHVMPGSTVAFGSYLGFETGLSLRGQYRVRSVRHVLALGDVRSPDGVKMFSRAATDDWVAIDVAPKNVNEFQAFSASVLIEQLRQSGAEYWVYSTGTATAPPSIIPAVEDAAGFERVAHWTFERVSGPPIETFIYRLDLGALAFDVSAIHISADALERLLAMIEAEGEQGVALAARIMDQIHVEPPSPRGDALVERLRALAGATGSR